MNRVIVDRQVCAILAKSKDALNELLIRDRQTQS
jgi:hypothetical protein